MNTYKSSDGNSTIFKYVWMPNKSPIGIIQLIHGNTEHMGRYNEFAKYFTERGYIVCGIDLLGHGYSKKDGVKTGYFGEKGSFSYLVKDVYKLYSHMHKKYPGIPYYMIGFSLGSFVLRKMLLSYKSLDIAQCYLIGTGHQNVFLLGIIRAIVRLDGHIHGMDSKTDLVQKLAFESYNSHFPGSTTRADWLIADNSSRDEYLNDPMCLERISSGMFSELLSAMIYCCCSLHHLAVHCPVFLLSGSEDAVGDFTKGIKKASRVLLKQGAGNTTIKFFDDMRHDILHENGHEAVFRYIEENLAG